MQICYLFIGEKTCNKAMERISMSHIFSAKLKTNELIMTFHSVFFSLVFIHLGLVPSKYLNFHVYFKLKVDRRVKICSKSVFITIC